MANRRFLKSKAAGFGDVTQFEPYLKRKTLVTCTGRVLALGPTGGTENVFLLRRKKWPTSCKL
eukprot:scaffold95351_cov60-Attheya_sp.AAC.4